MKIEKKTKAPAVRISPALLKASGLLEADSLELHALDSAVLVMKGEMTALGILSVIDSLTEVAGTLLAGLGQSCGQCEQCEEICPYLTGDDAGESEDLPYPTLDDLPPRVRELVSNTGICLGELSELLLLEEIVYGG